MLSFSMNQLRVANRPVRARWIITMQVCLLFLEASHVNSDIGICMIVGKSMMHKSELTL
jgi:hypothetical protein